MSAPSPSTEVEVSAELAKEVSSAVPCEWGELSEELDDCSDPAFWVLFVREYCGHGDKLGGDKTIMLCKEHKKSFQRLFKLGTLQCQACSCYMYAMSHVIQSVRRI